MVAYGGVGIAAGSAIGPLLGGIFTEQVSVYRLCTLFVLTLVVEMGVLGYCASECNILDPSHLFPSAQTGHRILQK